MHLHMHAHRILDSAAEMQNAEMQNAEMQNADSRCSTSDLGRRTLDSGFWILDSGFWILDSGFWILRLTLDSGFWILDSAHMHLHMHACRDGQQPVVSHMGGGRG